MTRRFLPVILPGALIFASTAVLGGVRFPRTYAGSARTALRVLFIVLLAGYYLRVSRPVVHHIEYSGLIPKLERLAGTIGDDDLVIAESRDTGSDVHVLALPLAYIYARNVLVLYQARPDTPTLAMFLEWAHTRYRRVLFIGGGGTDLLSHRYGVRSLASERFQVPEYDSPLNAFPRFVRQKEFEYGVLRVHRRRAGDRRRRLRSGCGRRLTTSTSCDSTRRRPPRGIHSGGPDRRRTSPLPGFIRRAARCACGSATAAAPRRLIRLT